MTMVIHKNQYYDYHKIRLDNILHNFLNISIDSLNNLKHIIEHYHLHNNLMDNLYLKHILGYSMYYLHTKFMEVILNNQMGIWIHMHLIMHQKMY